MDANTPHLTIISHADNPHPQAESIISKILEWLQIAELTIPLVVNVVSPTGQHTVSVNPATPPTPPTEATQ